MAGLKTAKFLGELAKNVTPDETEVFETYGVKEGMEKMPNLPRVAYVQMLQSQGLMHDTYVYGVDAKRHPVHHHEPHRRHGRCYPQR